MDVAVDDRPANDNSSVATGRRPEVHAFPSFDASTCRTPLQVVGSPLSLDTSKATRKNRRAVRSPSRTLARVSLTRPGIQFVRPARLRRTTIGSAAWETRSSGRSTLTVPPPSALRLTLSVDRTRETRGSQRHLTASREFGAKSPVLAPRATL